MTGFAIAEYLIVVLEVFLICDVSARGLKAEMVERKESLIYLCASVGMNVFFRCLGKAGVSAAEIFIFKSGILALLLWAVRRVSVWRAFLVFGCFQVLEELSRTWIVLLFCIGAEYADVGMVSILALNISRIMVCILVLRICEWQKSHEIEVNWMLVSLLFLIGSSAVFYFQNVLLGSSSKIVFKSSIWAMVVFLGILCMIYLIYHDMKQIKNKSFSEDIDITEEIVKPLQNQIIRMNFDNNAVRIINGSDIICVYGMSIGSTDKIWWKLVIDWLQRSTGNHLIILQHRAGAKFPFRWNRIVKEIRSKLFLYGDVPEEKRKSLENRIHIDVNHDIFSMNLRTDVAREPNNTGISVGLGASDVKKILDDMINEKTAKDEDVNAMLDDVFTH